MQITRDKAIRFALTNSPVLLFAAIFIGFGIAAPGFLQYQSLENAVKQASYIGVVAVGMTFVLLTAGIDLSVGSTMYVSAVAAGLVIQHYSAPVWVAFLVCLSVGALFGAFNALMIVGLRIVPFVATLGVMVAGRGLGQMLTQSRAVAFPDAVTHIGAAKLLGVVPYPIVIFAVVVACAWLILNRTTLGRQTYAAGHDIEAARKAGIPTGRVLATAYILCGMFAALGGFISVAQMGNINSGFGEWKEFDAIAAAVLGGVSLFGGIGRVFPGVVLGAVIIQLISAGLVSARIDLYLHPLFTAGIIFLAVLIDSLRSAQLARMSRRHIRIEDAN